MEKDEKGRVNTKKESERAIKNREADRERKNIR